MGPKAKLFHLILLLGWKPYYLVVEKELDVLCLGWALPLLKSTKRVPLKLSPCVPLVHQ